MLIDSSVVINLPHDGDFRTKRKEGSEDVRPVEKSGNSDEAELDISRDKITEKTPETWRFDAGTIYNKYGELDRDSNREEDTEMSIKSIDVIV